MASGPITLWQIEGEKVEAVTNFIFLGSKITVDGDCSREIKRRLLLEIKSHDHPGKHITKQRYYFDGNGLYSQSCGFLSSHVRM